MLFDSLFETFSYSDEVAEEQSVCHQPVRTLWKEPMASIDASASSQGTTYNSSPSIPAARFGHTAVVCNGRMYVFGGRDVDYYNDMWTFDFNTKKWEEMRPTGHELPAPRAGHTAVLSPKGVMLVFAGAKEQNHFLNDMWMYNLGTGTWSCVHSQSHIPAPRKGHTAILTGNQTLIVFGGGHEAGVDSHVYEFNIEKSCWKLHGCTGDVPRGRMYHVAEYDPVRNAMFVFGGRTSNTFLNDICILDLSTMRWARISCEGTIPTSRMCSSSFFRNGVLCVVAGGSTKYHDDNYAFDTTSKQWTAVPSVPSGRTRPTTVLCDNTIVMFGGCHDNECLNDVFVMELGPPSLKQCCLQWLHNAEIRSSHFGKEIPETLAFSIDNP